MIAPGRPVLGIDVGGTTFTVVLRDAAGRMRDAATAALPTGLAPAAAMKTVASAARAVAERAGVDPSELGGAGLAVPGSVDVERGVLRMAPNLPGWKDVPVGALAAEVLGTGVAVEHDVRMAALGEARLGAGHGVATFVCVTVGTGIGAAIVLDGCLYRGATDAAGELGHIRVESHSTDTVCGCGRRGCLETVASGRAIAARAGRATAAEVFAAAAAGDPGCARVVADAVSALAAGLTVLVNVLNPAVIAVGGGVAGAGAALLDPVRAAVRSSAWRPAAAAVRIVPAALGTRAGAIGAAIHVAEARRAC